MQSTDSRIRRISIKSAFQFSITLALVAALAQVIVFAALYFILNYLGVFDSVFPVVNDLFSTNITFRMILPYAGALVGFNVLVLIILIVFSSIIFNLVAAIIGGLKVKIQAEA
jgi:hypothetical protein